MTHRPLIEEISTHLYRAEIPLPLAPLRSLNSYIIKENERTLIVDTGMNEKVCFDAMSAVIKELSIELDQTDFFITHSHTDHIGLVPFLAKKLAKVYFNRSEADHVSSESLIGWAEKADLFTAVMVIIKTASGKW